MFASPANALLLLVVLIAILVAALAVNHYFHQREQRELRRREAMRKLRHEIQQVAEIMAAVKGAQGPATLLQPLADYAAELIGQLARLAPEDGLIENLQKQTGLEPVEAPTALHGVKRVQAGIKKCATLLALLQRRGRISAAELADYKKELSWLYSAVEVEHAIREGNKLRDAGKPARAIAFYKHAKSVVAKVSSKDPRRKEKLAQLDQLIAEANPYRPIASESSSSGEKRG